VIRISCLILELIKSDGMTNQNIDFETLETSSIFPESKKIKLNAMIDVCVREIRSEARNDDLLKR
jgi:hypothetical protein